MKKALLCIDFIHEIIGEGGKLAGKGYFAFAEKHKTLENLSKLQEDFRAAGDKVIHVHLAFGPDYADHPASSPLLGGARANGILSDGTPSVAIVESVAPKSGDLVMTKKRVSAFYGTSLEIALRSLGVTELVIAGVATDLAVQSAARDAHDRDFSVTIASEACAAASDDDHMSALANLRKLAKVS
jgi:nicotinamidase-related amidase